MKKGLLTIVYTYIDNPLRETSELLYVGFNSKKARQIREANEAEILQVDVTNKTINETLEENPNNRIVADCRNILDGYKNPYDVSHNHITKIIATIVNGGIR